VLYQFYELNHALVSPWRLSSQLAGAALNHPANPFRHSYPARATAAALDVFEGLTRRYGKPEFGISRVLTKDGGYADIVERDVLELDFCNLKHFERHFDKRSTKRHPDQAVLIVAPLSGHYATLLRGTVRALLEEFDVYITDWKDARDVAAPLGRFDLDDYTDYMMRFMRELGPELHVVAVCQPGPAVLAATALLAADDDDNEPLTVTLMGSPVDTRLSPTKPNELASSQPIEWFEKNAIMRVPFPHAGFMRKVYPGFLQLTGFMTMNLDRHMAAHRKLYDSLIKGDGDSISGHKKFYDEYLSVMDLPAEYYLQTVQKVFQEHQLARGVMEHRGRPIELGAITKAALMTVEGELDDISGIGQTQAAHDLCTNIPADRRQDLVQPGVGHYGVFNGSRWRGEIAPRIRDFMRTHYKRA
jgi:poly(3-hydroxybutyrate) depolymerase